MAARFDDQQTRLTPLHAEFGAIVEGFDFTQNYDAATGETLRRSLDEYSLLVFRNAGVTIEQQVAFSRLFGNLEIAISGLSNDSVGRHVSNLSNVDANGEIVHPGDQKMLSHAANRLWHTDSTFKPVAALASILSAVQLPPKGGETEFASTRAAWEALDLDTRQRIDGQYAIHDFCHSRAKVAPDLVSEHLRKKLPPQRRLLVKTNPATGRKSIYIASHAKAIEGLQTDEGLALIDDLLTHCSQQRFVYSHRWQRGDLVMWDNRATMHRGRHWDDSRHARVMYRTTVEDISSMTN